MVTDRANIVSTRAAFRILTIIDEYTRECLAILSLVQKLSACGVKVLSYQESWTEAPGELAELLHALTGWVARMESQRRSDRTEAGLVRARLKERGLTGPKAQKTDERERRDETSLVLLPLFLLIDPR